MSRPQPWHMYTVDIMPRASIPPGAGDGRGPTTSPGATPGTPAPSLRQPGTARDRLAVAQLPLRQTVREVIRNAILEGRYEQGARLFEDQLASELAVSRNPVREALQALAIEGFVVIEPRRGARVAVITPTLAAELFEVRGCLEGLVARLAAERRTPAQLAALQEVVDAGLTAASDGRIEELPELNRMFHEHLAAASANRLLADTLRRLAPLVEWVYRQRISVRSARSFIEHQGICEAIEAGDVSEAFTRATEHIEHARAAYLAAGE